MEIQIRSSGTISGKNYPTIRKKLKRVLKDLGCHDGELSILLTDDRGIAELNSRYLGREGPTNVLAFPMSPAPTSDVSTGMLGDIVISVERAAREARQWGDTHEEYIYRMLIHGILHLLDYDHERTMEEAEKMEREQERLMSLIKED
jgi:probable rRNA maturation factor